MADQISDSIPINCAAFSCPLAGTLSNGVSGKLKFYCRFHNGKHHSEFDEITTQIKKNLKLIEYFIMVNNGGPIAWRYVNTLPPKGYEMDKREQWPQYVMRLKAAIKNEIEKTRTDDY